MAKAICYGSDQRAGIISPCSPCSLLERTNFRGPVHQAVVVRTSEVWSGCCREWDQLCINTRDAQMIPLTRNDTVNVVMASCCGY